MTHIQLLPTKPITWHPIPEPRDDQRAFHSNDAEQFAKWLREGRCPTCYNDGELVDRVQELYERN